MKKILALLCVANLILCLSACSLPDGNVDTLLSPPAPTGELRNVWQTLKKSAGEDITLKYPSSGDFRSAIILQDLNLDGSDEAIAFYSTTFDNVTTMHIGLIAKSGEEWISGGDVSLTATGVETVEFADIDGNGVLETIVSWNVYANVQKSIGVYSVSDTGLVCRILEDQTSYVCTDFNFDGNPDLLIINNDNIKSVSIAKLMDLTIDGVKEIGTCQLDASVTKYLKPKPFNLGTKTAVYLDGIKGTGMITEMLVIENDTITNLSLSTNETTAFDTFRSGSAKSYDINGDEIPDIPISYLLTQSTTTTDENVYKTNWYTYNGEGVILTLSTILNLTDGYYIVIPEKWDGVIAATLKKSENSLTVFRLDTHTGSSAEMLLKITAIEKGENLTATLTGSTKIAENNTTDFYATIGTYNGPEAIKNEELSSLFQIITNTEDLK